MATADSNTNARSEIEAAVTTLLKTPLNTTMDLFQVLDYCQHHADVLIESTFAGILFRVNYAFVARPPAV